MSDEPDRMLDADEQEQFDDRLAPPARVLHAVLVKQGEDELDRSARSLFYAGLAAGLAIHLSLLAQAALHAMLPDAPWREAVSDIGYCFGFVIVILGRLQLFTESTVTAVLPLARRPGWRALARTARLWTIVLAANLVGTFAVALLSTRGGMATADQIAAMVTISFAILEHGGWATFAHAIPAGFLVASIPWVLIGARENAFWVIVAVTYAIALGNFAHVVVGSDEAFVLMFTGHATPAQVLAFLLPALAGNIVGGSGLFALLAHAQVQDEI